MGNRHAEGASRIYPQGAGTLSRGGTRQDNRSFFYVQYVYAHSRAIIICFPNSKGYIAFEHFSCFTCRLQRPLVRLTRLPNQRYAVKTKVAISHHDIPRLFDSMCTRQSTLPSLDLVNAVGSPDN